MTEEKLFILEKMIEDGNVKPNEVSSSFTANVANRIIDVAHQNSNDGSFDLANQLLQLVHQFIKNSETGLLRDIIGTENKSDSENIKIRQAYKLGALSFASELTSMLAHRKPDKEYFEILEDDSYQSIFKALMEDDMSYVQLEEKTGMPLDKIKEKIRRCMQFGLINTRSNGVCWEYFLSYGVRSHFE